MELQDDVDEDDDDDADDEADPRSQIASGASSPSNFLVAHVAAFLEAVRHNRTLQLKECGAALCQFFCIRVP